MGKVAEEETAVVTVVPEVISKAEGEEAKVSRDEAKEKECLTLTTLLLM